MDSVSVLLNIFRPKCKHAAELWTFRILKCSQLESRFFVIQYVSHRCDDPKKKKTYLPYLMLFQPLPEPHNYFFWPKGNFRDIYYIGQFYKNSYKKNIE